MTDLERIEVQVQRQIDMQNARIDKIDVKLDAFIEEMRDFKTEMRDRDNQRAAETAALRAEMIESDKAIRAEMAEIRSSLQNIQLSGRNTNIMMFLGIAAMVIAV